MYGQSEWRREKCEVAGLLMFGSWSLFGVAS